MHGLFLDEASGDGYFGRDKAERPAGDDRERRASNVVDLCILARGILFGDAEVILKRGPGDVRSRVSAHPHEHG
jgi:hypothetical protein